MTKAGGPPPPILAELLGQRAVDGKPPQAVAFFPAILIEAGVAGKFGPDRPQRILFQTEHRVTIDQPLGVQGPAGGGELRQLGAQPLGARHVLDPQVKRVAIAAAAGMVGAVFLGQDGCRGVKRIDQQ